jgi:hypothetical protein
VSLYDRVEKQVEFFTFGGTVDVVSDSGALIYAFRSSAPILELTSPEETASDQLAYEAEGILAETEEQWEERYPSEQLVRCTPIRRTPGAQDRSSVLGVSCRPSWLPPEPQ